MLKVWIVQEQLQGVLSNKTEINNAQSPGGTEVVDKMTTPIPEIVMQYFPCQKSLEGECSDAVIREGDFVLAKSARLLASAVGYDRLAYPEARLGNKRYLVLRLMGPSESSNPEADVEVRNHVFVLDLLTRKVMDVKTPVPMGAQYSSDGGVSAAYIKESNGDYREVVVVDLLKDVAETVAKAKRSEMFWNGVTPPKIKQFDGKNVVFEVYTSSDATHALPTLQETRTVEIGK